MTKLGLPENIAEIWDREIVRVTHDLPDNPLFSDEALTELVANNPDAVREIATMDTSVEDKSRWRASDISPDDPQGLFNAVRSGALWVNIGHVGGRDARYQKLIDDIMDQIDDAVPGPASYSRQIGILISSPRARVYYHADVPGQGLIHIRGEKRIWLYPGHEPYLKPEELERVVTAVTAEEISYDPSYDAAATVIDLTPGTALFWPLNWPHRVVNADSLNVSATVEYHTPKTRRHFAVNYANGVLRHGLGVTPRSRAIGGAGFWGKAAFAYACRKSGLARRLLQSAKGA
ncbi:cupin-like domain-containing protein [Stappia indica]|uniref:Cupin-like domain-containing protein n=1 Tax=Stappia indica TaxID=538381 RepID=A0A285R9N8_9HYPH|nr:cupin-like domain-containing protein [Stappia indica]SOB89132.1 Cupin-like domain-containing protein [Stappia indica]